MGNNPRIDPNFGNGEVGGDRNWTPPVYGHTGIASGHVTGAEYYKKNDGHDHYGPNGESHADRGRYYND